MIFAAVTSIICQHIWRFAPFGDYCKIKEDIKNGINTTVISTSLIEAGVDLDFKGGVQRNCGN